MLRTPLIPVRGWAAAVLAAAAVASTPSPAAAGCGDYLVIRDTADAPAADHDPAPGPDCHEAPAPAPLAPVAAPPVGSPKDRAADGAFEPPATTGDRFPIPTSDPCPDGLAAGVFHPPRAG